MHIKQIKIQKLEMHKKNESLNQISKYYKNYASSKSLGISKSLAKKNKLFGLIDDYYKSLTSITINQIQLSDSSTDWIIQQQQFVNTLHKKINKYSTDKNYSLYYDKLEEVKQILNNIKQNYKSMKNLFTNQNIDDSNLSREQSAIRMKKTQLISHSIQKLKQTLSAKENLLEKNLQQQRKKNQELLVQLKKQIYVTEQQSKQISSLKCELQNLKKHPNRIQRNTVTDSGKMKKMQQEIMILLQSNEKKEDEIIGLKKMIEHQRNNNQKQNYFSQRTYKESQRQSNQLKKYEIENEKLINQINKLNDHIQHLQKKMGEGNSNNKQLQSKDKIIQKLLNQSQIYSHKYQQLKHKFEDFENQYRRLETHFQNLSHQLKILESQNSQLREKINYGHQGQHLQQKQLENNNLRFQELIETNQLLSETIKQLKLEIKTAEQKADLYKERYYRIKQNRDNGDTPIFLQKKYSQQNLHLNSTGLNEKSVDKCNQQKKLKVLSDLKDLVKNHRMALQTLR